MALHGFSRAYLIELTFLHRSVLAVTRHKAPAVSYGWALSPQVRAILIERTQVLG